MMVEVITSIGERCRTSASIRISSPLCWRWAILQSPLDNLNVLINRLRRLSKALEPWEVRLR